MAVYAAMVESIDMGVGKILNHLEKTNELDRTLILFLSDNGACYEWGPFGFDGDSRKGITKLHTQEELRQIGRPGTHQAYGSAWANLSNTPLRSYKHFTYEGGIINPCILLYPPMTQQASAQQAWVHHPSHMIDVMPTILEATGAKYPTQDEIPDLHRLEGHSLFDIARGEQRDRTLGFDHQAAHGLRQGDWKVVWTKRSADPIRWELFDLSQDRCETQDVSNQHPERLKQMVTEWERWASRVLVDYKKLW
jgi:arylsulfatase